MYRSGYSFRVAAGKIDEVLKRLKEIGHTTAPLADRNSTFGFVRWTKAAKKLGLRPIYGVELAVTEKLGEKEGAFDYWRFLAIDNLRPLHDLVYEATLANQHEPALLYSQALAAQGVIKITGPNARLELFNKASDLYIGIYPSTPLAVARAAMEGNFNLLAMSDNSYPTEGDRELYRVALHKTAKTSMYPQHILSDAEWKAATARMLTPEAQELALRNRANVLQLCHAELRKAEMLVPEKPKSLRAMCEDGAGRVGVDLKDAKYAERLQHELQLIEDKKFEDYFYIIADLVAWAKQRMVVGPARGSSCGSLVCYLLGITAIDPLKYNLLFERFIDHTRSDTPDIDIDFDDEQRDLLFTYAENKYGQDHVARLGTVGTFMPKSALNQVGLALRIPKWEIESVADSIIQRSSGDARALLQLQDTLENTEAGQKLVAKHPNVLIAARMEGHPTVPSQHAAGVLLTKEPVRNFVAVHGERKASMCDKKDAEELNLLKIDALGLTQLRIFARTMELTGREPRSEFMERIPLDDPAAFDVLNRKHFSGIFQFAGNAVKNLASQIQFSSVNDLIVVTALARPGPIATGGSDRWARRKSGRTGIIEYTHDLVKPYLEETLGIIVYQEQVMQICRVIGGLSWGDVNALRRAMSKSLGQEYFDQFGNRWKANAIKLGIPEETAHFIWNDLCAFGAMGFNKAHAVAYGIVSYWCCYLKAHHPLEFAAATLDAESDPARQIEMLRELEAEGVGYVAIDPKHSTDKWQPVGRMLIGPLTNVHGIGPAGVRAIREARKTGNEIPPRYAKKLREARTPIDTLYPVRDGLLKKYPEGLAKAHTIITAPTPINKIELGARGVVIIGICTKQNPRDANEDVNVERRKAKFPERTANGWDGKVTGPRWSLNFYIADDSGSILCSIDRFKFVEMGSPMMERGKTGTAIYAVKGKVPVDFRMLQVQSIKYLGDLEEITIGQKETKGGKSKLNAGEQTNAV